MNPNVLIHEQLALIATVDPAVCTASYSDYIDMTKFQQIMGVLLTGNMGSYAIDFVAYAYINTSAGNETEIKSITQWAASASTSDNSQAIIAVRNEDILAKANSSGYALRYVRFKITSGSQDGPSAIVVLGQPYKGPTSEFNLASIQEIEDDLS